MRTKLFIMDDVAARALVENVTGHCAEKISAPVA
jgi:hypothetical protein